MDNFLRMNNAESVDSMYGKEVYFTLFPNDSEKHFVYKGVLLGYGAYGTDPDHKTFCVYVDRGDGYRFVDYFRDECFKSKEEYEEFIRRRKEECETGYTVKKLKNIMDIREEHIDVYVKVGDMVYPVNGIAEMAKSVKEPAFVIRANAKEGKEWLYE